MHKFDGKSSENKGLQPKPELPGRVHCALSAKVIPAPRVESTQSSID